ncbi:Alpha/Beta hydrolase protein [Xylariales sp. PMI_506]|nr:Alpha/Beta hydrolase protein [Xylariales sp. PMI_506]
MPYLDHDGVSLFYTDEGTGPAVLLIHGWLCDSHDWSFQIPALLDHGFRVVAMDLRAHGRSTAPRETASCSMAIMAEDAHALLRHLGLGSVVVLAHSMGGTVASVLAVEHPEDVRALIVVQPIYFTDAPPVLAFLDAVREADAEAARRLVVDIFRRFMFTPRTPAWLRTWSLRRNAGASHLSILGCLEGIAEVNGKITGPSEQAVAYLRRRHHAPRLIACCMPGAQDFEERLGLEEGRDECYYFEEGVFSHIVEAERFNDLLTKWLIKQGMTATS